MGDLLTAPAETAAPKPMAAIRPVRVLLVTDDHVFRGPAGPTARLASTRLRLLVALEALTRLGHHAILVANTTADNIAASVHFAGAERLLFGKVFQDYRPLVERARRAGKRIAVDVTDDLERQDALAQMRALVDHADLLTVPSDGLAKLVTGWTDGRLPVHRIVDPWEGAMRAVGGDPGRRPARIVWFGSPGNAQYLNPHLPGLVSLADRCPIDLTLVTAGSDAFRGLVTRFHAQRGGPLRLRFVDWSPDAQARELAAADLAILPADRHGESALKSANRLIATIAAGRFCVATPLPSYRPFADHALLTDDIVAGVEAALGLPASRIHAAVRAGQALVRRDYAVASVGRRWLEVLSRLTPTVPGA